MDDPDGSAGRNALNRARGERGSKYFSKARKETTCRTSSGQEHPVEGRACGIVTLRTRRFINPRSRIVDSSSLLAISGCFLLLSSAVVLIKSLSPSELTTFGQWWLFFILCTKFVVPIL
ncbi:hypothetical protein CEXT_768911 [Caerostris extrusa]|uniref:Uncharacterized protein n=1 Tax=Caerostris extrusa TaxID=172846 RepID=A0AAV4V633_CAEEX|nr:hypothetical protein CEXT_768911 [Caerostris extrusa]